MTATPTTDEISSTKYFHPHWFLTCGFLICVSRVAKQMLTEG